VVLLGVAPTVVAAAPAWHPVQFAALGVAWAGSGLIVTIIVAAARPTASTESFGTVIRFKR
jgi:hypothetical protein